MALTLILGNKNYSSWSLRPWIAMKVAKIPFDERVIPLYEPGSREEVLKYSPAGKVPVLIDGDSRVWETLAILEHLAEKFPEASPVAEGRRRAQPCPRGGERNACRLYGAAAQLPDEPVAAAESAAAAG